MAEQRMAARPGAKPCPSRETALGRIAAAGAQGFRPQAQIRCGRSEPESICSVPRICWSGSRVSRSDSIDQALQIGSGAQVRAIARGSKARGGYLVLLPKPSELVRVTSPLDSDWCAMRWA